MYNYNEQRQADENPTYYNPHAHAPTNNENMVRNDNLAGDSRNVYVAPTSKETSTSSQTQSQPQSQWQYQPQSYDGSHTWDNRTAQSNATQDSHGRQSQSSSWNQTSGYQSETSSTTRESQSRQTETSSVDLSGDRKETLASTQETGFLGTSDSAATSIGSLAEKSLLQTIARERGMTIHKVDLDPQSLLNLIQQQSYTIASMQSELKALKHEVSAMSAKLASERRSQSVDPYYGNQVAFTAHMSQSEVTVGAMSPFIFDKVVTNIGNGYEPTTGVFTAPHQGVYVFFFSIVNHGDGNWITAVIEKWGTPLATVHASGGSAEFDKASSMATTWLHKGDQVFVRRVGGSPHILGEPMTMFSGFLISSEP